MPLTSTYTPASSGFAGLATFFGDAVRLDQFEPAASWGRARSTSISGAVSICDLSIDATSELSLSLDEGLLFGCLDDAGGRVTEGFQAWGMDDFVVSCDRL